MPVSKKTMDLYQILRCADVCDALDSMGLQDRYEMALNMRPMFGGIRFAGPAHTQEFDRYDRRMPAMSYEEFDKKQYAAIEDGGYSSYARPGVAKYDGTPGEVLVIAARGTRAGILGSANTLSYMAKGKQYIAMVVGYGSGWTVTFPKLTPEIALPHASSSAIFVFALPDNRKD